MQKLKPEHINELAETLDGTCRDLDTELEKLGTNFATVHIDSLAALDEIVLCCSQCGWWSESADFDDSEYCKECREENIENASEY